MYMDWQKCSIVLSRRLDDCHCLWYLLELRGAVSVWTWLTAAEMPRTPSGHFWHTKMCMTSGTDVAHGEAHQGTTTLHHCINISDSLLLYLSRKTQLVYDGHGPYAGISLISNFRDVVISKTQCEKLISEIPWLQQYRSPGTTKAKNIYHQTTYFFPVYMRKLGWP